MTHPILPNKHVRLPLKSLNLSVQINIELKVNEKTLLYKRKVQVNYTKRLGLHLTEI